MPLIELKLLEEALQELPLHPPQLSVPLAGHPSQPAGSHGPLLDDNLCYGCCFILPPLPASLW
jgi:hypothetical protein